MTRSDRDPKERFRGRVQAYARARPGYPSALVEYLQREAGLTAHHLVADIGAGTGLSSAPFVRLGNRVFAIEPNPQMRRAAGRWLGGFAGFVSLAGSAEATGLPNRSVDWVIAGQAFHWFRTDACLLELRRILRPGGRLALFWNTRREAADPFHEDYERLLRAYGTDYRQVQRRTIDENAVRRLTGGRHQYRRFDNRQSLDLSGFVSRLLSTSYLPGPDDDGCEAMLKAARELFEHHQRGGLVTIKYDTELFFGPLAPADE